MGRNRKQGERYATGRLKPSGTIRSGAAWQQLLRDNYRLATDPRITSEVGRLSWFGELTNAQAAAALRIGAIYGRYESLKGLPRSARSPSYMVGCSGAALLDSEQLETMAKDIATATAAFQQLNGGGGKQGEIPVRLRSVVEDLCVEDRPVNPVVYDDLRELFQKLAGLWKMTGAAKRDPEARKDQPPLHFNRHQDHGVEFQQAIQERQRFRHEKRASKP